MTRIIWSLWLQGRNAAPEIVSRCLDSWELMNPGWKLRCLDARSIDSYIPLSDYIDLDRQTITAASISDIARILLLNEYGGVWVDATTYCNRPLDDWLGSLMGAGFFAFEKPGPDRPLSSWFLAAKPGSNLVSRWCDKTLAYWKDRTEADAYFWFHNLFAELLLTDPDVCSVWADVPKISADGPHAIQAAGLYQSADGFAKLIDWSVPLFKLTHRLEPEQVGSHTLLARLLGGPLSTGPSRAELPSCASSDVLETVSQVPVASLKVSTDNLGDHIQIIASMKLLRRFGVEPTAFIDRDDEIGSAPTLPTGCARVPIVLNGWFKRNGKEWPPNPRLAPLFVGLHFRTFQCPELLSEASIAYLRRHEPIGCRDVHTFDLLSSLGVKSYLSQCLSLTFWRRPALASGQGKTLVVSRDDRILSHLPAMLGSLEFVSHYSGSANFETNMDSAERLLGRYRSEATLIVTTLLHCALPAIAMGIPVVVFYPINDDFGHASDRERFSSLATLTRIYDLGEMSAVNWTPDSIEVGGIKLNLRDRIAEFVRTTRAGYSRALGPIAPPTSLPPP